VLHFITVNEQSESYQDNSFHSSIASFIFGRSYHQHLFISTVEYFKCLYSGRKKSPRNTSLVQLFVLSGLSGSYNVTWCTRNSNILRTHPYINKEQKKSDKLHDISLFVI